MRNILNAILPSMLGLAACTSVPSVRVIVNNPSSLQRTDEIVEIPVESLQQLNLEGDETFVVLSADGLQVPYQITYDSLLIFPVSVDAGAEAVYSLRKGVPERFDTVCCGKQYPERADDFAWENDKSAYRAYGPALQRRGERAFGYDIFTKSVPYPVVAERYRRELDPATRALEDSLRKAGNRAAADSVSREASYHVDHGNGLDCYSVGPTLGAGTTALMVNSTIIYPWSYLSCEVLDNGPLRMTVRLEYPSVAVNGDSAVTETRLISLDKSSHLNRTIVSYQGLSDPCDLATGIVLHPQHPDGFLLDPSKRYIAYADSTDNPANGNGVIYIGAVFATEADDVTVNLYSEEEQKEHAGAIGHVLGINRYVPETTFTYYWGSGWSKAGVKDMKEWETYLQTSVYRLNNPLVITIK